MRMADFALAVSGVTRNVVSMSMNVCVLMGMFMVVAATTCIPMCVSMCMLFMIMLMVTCALMGMSAATCIAVCVSMFVFFMLVVITCALMGMSTDACVTVRMLRHMSHRLMIMVLATMAAGAAFRMLAIIFYAINATINMLVSSYIVSTITDIFEIFLHYIYHLSA